MTEGSPPPREKGEKQPRDAAFWAQRIERLEVSEVPEGAANVNVQGRREVGALQGFGQLWQKTYRVRLTGVEVTPEEAVRIWKERFRVVGATEQERLWTHVLKSLAGHFGVNEPVTLEKACVDPKVQWSQIKNVWHNAGARSMLYTMTGPGRWMRGLMRRRST